MKDPIRIIQQWILAQFTHQLSQFFRETNTFSPNSCRKMKSSTLLNTINRCRTMTGNRLALEANFERLAPS